MSNTARPREDRLKAGERLPQADWGYDMRDGAVTLSRDDLLAEQPLLNIPGNYPAYYAAVRDAIAGIAENPVPAADAIAVMALIELGWSRPGCSRRCRWPDTARFSSGPAQRRAFYDFYVQGNPFHVPLQRLRIDKFLLVLILW